MSVEAPKHNTAFVQDSYKNEESAGRDAPHRRQGLMNFCTGRPIGCQTCHFPLAAHALPHGRTFVLLASPAAPYQLGFLPRSAPSISMADRTSVLQAPAQPPINALPPGLLELIVRRFEQRPLLWVVSLVCKQWRRASLASLTALTLNSARLSKPLALTTFAQCTGLKSVTVRCDASSSPASLPQPLRCPPSLTHLTLNDASQSFMCSPISPCRRCANSPSSKRAAPNSRPYCAAHKPPSRCSL